jgi:hypothetical protein
MICEKKLFSTIQELLSILKNTPPSASPLDGSNRTREVRSMNRFRAVFANRHVVLPVIHAVSAEQILRNIRIARDAGADGAFLISHGRVSEEKLLEIYQKTQEAEPGFWLGANFLTWSLQEVFPRVAGIVSGIWSDDALVDERQPEQTAAQQLHQLQASCGWTGLHFGGVAFKYQRPVKDLAAAALAALPWLDVVTTSGPGTGQAAPPQKIRTMKEAIGSFPLAIASGVSPLNVSDYLPFADCFMVATGISLTFDELDPAGVRDLVRVVRTYQE